MSMPANLLSYIVLNADEGDLERIIQAVKDRRRTLRDAVAASVTEGATVTLDGLSPKALNGLVGDVVTIRGKRADVLLTEKSTDGLRWTRTRFYVDPDVKRHLLAGVPTSCCKVTPSTDD